MKRALSSRVTMARPQFDDRGSKGRWPMRDTNKMLAGMLGLRDNPHDDQTSTAAMAAPSPPDAYLANLGRTGSGFITLVGIEWVIANFPDGFPDSIATRCLTTLAVECSILEACGSSR